MIKLDWSFLSRTLSKRIQVKVFDHSPGAGKMVLLTAEHELEEGAGSGRPPLSPPRYGEEREVIADKQSRRHRRSH